MDGMSGMSAYDPKRVRQGFAAPVGLHGSNPEPFMSAVKVKIPKRQPTPLGLGVISR